MSPVAASPPLEDADLDSQFQQAVAGITSLPGNLVRPRWQPNNPKQPEPATNWCAIGVMDVTPDAGPFINHDPIGNGSDYYVRHEQIDLACTFYGPQAQTNATALRDGLAIPQNMETLNTVGIYFIECQPIRPVPELVNQQWIRRYDLMVSFRRQVKRTYAVLSVLSANVDLISDEIGEIKNQTIEE